MLVIERKIIFFQKEPLQSDASVILIHQREIAALSLVFVGTEK